MSYPPSHRSVEDPQPEVCDLCGLMVGGAHLATSEVEGLEGYRICDVTPGCRAFRSSPTFNDRRRTSGRVSGTIGSSRVFEAGGDFWFR